jgi:hypothetical protein
MHQKGTDASNYEQGSSWAVEVGGHLKVSSIIVENLNKNGQMLVEVNTCWICKFQARSIIVSGLQPCICHWFCLFLNI